MLIYSWTCNAGCHHKISELTDAELNLLEVWPVREIGVPHEHVVEQIEIIRFARKEGIPL